jgi:ATP-dependent RNA helicase SUPV3L1/SUV3
MWEKLNGMGKQCALRTGEVTSGPIDHPELGHDQVDTLACTVEMLDLNREFDVAIIDEIQLLADEQRGWAFTQALLGVNAREIYLCGEEAAVPLIHKIAAETGDIVQVIRYQRLAPLVISERSLDGTLANLKPGDCAVAFSRKKIFQMKYLIESQTGQKCSVVYGNLPMENRTLQAREFNERQNGVKIMVASDAVGMGLNLYAIHD